LRIIGNLPKLTTLDLDYGQADWFGLLPAAGRLQYLSIDFLDTNDDNFTALLLSMTSLKSLVFIGASDNCETMLCKISSLPLLEELRLVGMDCPCRLLYIGTGPIRRSLSAIEIHLRVNDEQLRLSLLRCFKERLVPMFEKPATGARELCFER